MKEAYCSLVRWLIDSDHLAVIISIFALGLSTFLHFRTYSLSKRQGVASVKPFLDVRSTINIEKMEIIVKLGNYGIGPAFLKSFKYKYINESFNTFKEYLLNINNIIKDQLQQEMLINNTSLCEDDINNRLFPTDNTHITYELRLYNNAIGVGEEKTLLKISANEKKAFEKLRNKLSKITIYSEYMDIYENDIEPMNKFL